MSASSFLEHLISYISRRAFLQRHTGPIAGALLIAPFQRVSIAQEAVPNATLFHPINYLHQIVIVDGLGMPETLSDVVSENIAQFKSIYPDAMHRLWTGEMLRDFIFDRFGRDVLQAFDSFKPYAFKADLARYCLLHALGGLYSDLGVRHASPWNINRTYRIAGFRELALRKANRFHVSNTLLWSQPNVPTLEMAINRIVSHYKSRFYGLTCLDPSGPGVLGWAWANRYIEQWQRGAVDDQYLGLTEFSYTDGPLALTFFPTGMTRRAIACRSTREGGDSRFIGAAGTNNYKDMWESRNIYG